MKRFILAAITMSVITFDSYSQDQWDSSIPETMFLGRTVDDYLKTVKGSMYILDDFKQGKIKFIKGEDSGLVLMNINAYIRELNIKKTVGGLPLALDLNTISEVSITDVDKERKFRKIEPQKFDKSKQDSFLYEVLFDSKVVTLIKEDVILLNKAESGGYATGPKEDQFISSIVYYLAQDNGTFFSTNLSKSSMQKIINSELMSSIESYMKKNGLSWKAEDDLVKALNAMGSN